MKRALLLLILSSTLCVAQDTGVTLPNAKILQERLNRINMHFAEKTKIVSKLAEREIYPLGVVLAIDAFTSDYLDALKKSGWSAPELNMLSDTMYIQRPLFLEVFLKDHPKALDELQKLGVYEPTRSKL